MYNENNRTPRILTDSEYHQYLVLTLEPVITSITDRISMRCQPISILSKMVREHGITVFSQVS